MTLSILTLNLWHNSGPWEQRRDLIREWVALAESSKCVARTRWTVNGLHYEVPSAEEAV